MHTVDQLTVTFTNIAALVITAKIDCVLQLKAVNKVTLKIYGNMCQNESKYISLKEEIKKFSGKGPSATRLYPALERGYPFHITTPSGPALVCL